MGRAKVAHQPVIQGRVRCQVSSGRRDAFDNEGLECWICSQADGQADSFAHALTVKGICEVTVVQKWLHIGIWRREPQLAGAQGELETTTDPEVVVIIVDSHLRRAMLTGHEYRGNLHVILEIRSLDRIAQPDLDGRGLHIGPLAGHTEEHGGGGMVTQILADAWQVMLNLDANALETA